MISLLSPPTTKCGLITPFKPEFWLLKFILGDWLCSLTVLSIHKLHMHAIQVHSFILVLLKTAVQDGCTMEG